MKNKKQKIKYHEPPMKFDYALMKYVPDIEKLTKFKKKLKRQKSNFSTGLQKGLKP